MPEDLSDSLAQHPSEIPAGVSCDALAGIVFPYPYAVRGR